MIDDRWIPQEKSFTCTLALHLGQSNQSTSSGGTRYENEAKYDIT